MPDFPIGITDKNNVVFFTLAMANRHGLIAGATGTGKTVTLQLLAESFAKQGVNVFTADVKGDLSGVAFPAVVTPKLQERLTALHINNFSPEGNSVVFWDVYGKYGHPLRTTVTEMGPLLLGRLFNLNETQQGVLQAAFSLAEDQKLLLLDLKDLSSILEWMLDNTASLKTKYGNIAQATIGSIQRAILNLSEAGGEQFFGEPALNINNFFQRDSSGKGIINILDATKLIADSRLYSTFLLWLLTELFAFMPEVGDQEKPKLVFFFDEAHLLFNSAPKLLLEKIEQLVRLVRSKGVGVYFVTQSPSDVPETVLSQLSNRVQHALRAFTPKDEKAVKVTAETLRKNPDLDTATAITQLGVGEALVSLLDATGTPAIVEKIKVYPPTSRIGSITDAERQTLIKNSPFFGIYDQPIDRESAYEIISKRMAEKQASATAMAPPEQKKTRGRPKDTVFDAVLKSSARSFGTQIGRQILRAILGVIFPKK